jgi:hypothetical protein
MLVDKHGKICSKQCDMRPRGASEPFHGKHNNLKVNKYQAITKSSKPEHDIQYQYISVISRDRSPQF